MLSAAVVSHALSHEQQYLKHLEVVAYEIDPNVTPFLLKTFEMCTQLCSERGIEFSCEIRETDFVSSATFTAVFRGAIRCSNIEPAIPANQVGLAAMEIA